MDYLFFLAVVGWQAFVSVWVLLYWPDKDNYSCFIIKILAEISLASDVVVFFRLVRLLYMEACIRTMNRETRRLEASTLDLQSQIPGLAQDDYSPWCKDPTTGK